MEKPNLHLVAYIDMLAGTHMIYKDEEYENLNNVHALYKGIVEKIQKDKAYTTRYIDIKIFSDNILISSKAYFETPKIIRRTIFEFFDIIQELQYRALCKNILLRGAIDYGELFIDSNFVWGKALVEAHNLEQKALVPRIILSNNTIDFLEKLDDKFKSISIFNRLPLLSDIDDELYINYLSFWKNNFRSEDEVEIWTNFLKEELSKNSNNYKIMVKLNWLKQYHNEFCDYCEENKYAIEQKINAIQLQLFDTSQYSIL